MPSLSKVFQSADLDVLRCLHVRVAARARQQWPLRASSNYSLGESVKKESAFAFLGVECCSHARKTKVRKCQTKVAPPRQVMSDNVRKPFHFLGLELTG